LDEALRVLRRVAALHADGERLGDLVGHGEQLGHGMEWPAEIIGVEPGDQDTLAHVGEPHHERDDLLAEKLRFVNSDDLGAQIEPRIHIRRVAHGGGADLELAVRDDVIAGVAFVNARLEDLHALAGDLRAPQPANQLFALAAEHRPAHHLDPSQTAFGEIHLDLDCRDAACGVSETLHATSLPCRNPHNSSILPKISLAHARIQPLTSSVGSGGTS